MIDVLHEFFQYLPEGGAGGSLGVSYEAFGWYTLPQGETGCGSGGSSYCCNTLGPFYHKSYYFSSQRLQMLPNIDLTNGLDNICLTKLF
jgi:hypothetical protein